MFRKLSRVSSVRKYIAQSPARLAFAAACVATAILSLPLQTASAQLSSSTSTRGDGDTLVDFTSGSGDWTIPAGVTSVQVLVVGGGGGAGNQSSGGGAGGMYYTATYAVTSGSNVYVAVGAGGTAGVGSGGSIGGYDYTAGGTGVASQFDNLIAYGGGVGGGYDVGGNQGGYSVNNGGTITPGNSGGSAAFNGTYASGAGAGAPGVVGNSSQGGIGLQNSITGTATYYAGGGAANTSGAPQLGGGGAAVGYNSGAGDPSQMNGTNGLGGGGGGGWGGIDNGVYGGGSGGSGVVIVAYAPAITNSSVLNLTPTTTSSPNSTTAVNLGNLLSGAIVSSSATTNMTLASTAATTYSSSASLNGGTPVTSLTGATSGSVSGLVVTDSAAGSFSGSGSNTLGVSLDGTEPNGTDSWSYVVTNAGNSGDTQGVGANKTVTINAVVGNAIPDESGAGTFTANGATVLSATVATNASYAGLASYSNGGVQAVNPNSGEPGIEGSSAMILLGNNTIGTGTVSIVWRTRMLAETATYDAVNNPPFTVNGTKTSGLPLISDVVDLFGMGSGSTMGSTTPIQTDPFAFEMSYNPTTLNNEGAYGNAEASRGNLYLASLVGGAWVNTIMADLGSGPNAFTTNSQTTTAVVNGQTIVIGDDASEVGAMNGNFNKPILESFSTWQTYAEANLGLLANGTNLGDFVGVWGVNTSGDEAWAVIEHNSEFAVVPEPSTLLLACMAAVGLIFVARRGCQRKYGALPHDLGC